MPTNNSNEMKLVKKNIRMLDKFLSEMPDSNEKILFQQVFYALDNMRKLVGSYKEEVMYIGSKHNSRLIKLEKSEQ